MRHANLPADLERNLRLVTCKRCGELLLILLLLFWMTKWCCNTTTLTISLLRQIIDTHLSLIT